MSGLIPVPLLGLIILATPAVAGAFEDARPAPEPKLAEAETYPPLGQEPPPPFVPVHPRSAEDQQRVDALRLYVAARALEEQRRLTQAIGLLEQAHQKDPESVAILRRLAMLCFARGKTDQAI